MKVDVIRRARAAAFLGPVLLAVVAAGSAAPAPKPASAGKPATAARTAAAPNRLSVPLPDSVVARVFTGTGAHQAHDITRTQVITAAARAGRRVDSLTPDDRREFLGVLVDQAVLVAQVHKESRRWDRRDSADWNALRDRLVLRAALDSAMLATNFERAARGDSLLGPQELGVAVRERAMLQLAPAWNEPALRTTANAFDTLPQPDSRMSMVERMRVAGLKPSLAGGDSALMLVESAAGSYTLGELVRDWSRVNPMYRPRISTVDNVKDVVANQLLERMLRQRAAAQGLERHPDIARQLAERAEYLDVAKFVAREVYEKIARDSVTLRRHFESGISNYDIEERATVVRLTLASRDESEAMRQRLSTPAGAESLVAQSGRAGVSYTTVMTFSNDSALFRRMARGGVGAVLGPDSTSDGWRVVKLLTLEPRRHRTYHEAQPMVERSWYDREGERLMRGLLDGLRRRAVIKTNDRAMGGPPAKAAR